MPNPAAADYAHVDVLSIVGFKHGLLASTSGGPMPGGIVKRNLSMVLCPDEKAIPKAFSLEAATRRINVWPAQEHGLPADSVLAATVDSPIETIP
jgi:hypothetical protein